MNLLDKTVANLWINKKKNKIFVFKFELNNFFVTVNYVGKFPQIFNKWISIPKKKS